MSSAGQQPDQNQQMFTETVRPLYSSALVVVLGLMAIAYWSSKAPLSTTIRANGLLVSSHQSFELQHPYGGSIQQIYVKLHDHLEQGQEILKLDVSRQIKTLDQIELQIEHLASENEVIETLLVAEPIYADAKTPMVHRHFIEMHQELSVNLASSIASGITLRDQAAATQSSLDQMRKNLALMEGQREQVASLHSQGLSTKTQTDELSIRVFNMAAELADKEASLIALEDKAMKAELQQDLLKSRFRLDILSRFTANQAKLPELERRAISLRDEIDNATVFAPIAGTVASLEFGTETMFIPRGRSIATIAQPLQSPTIEFTIPVVAIEQTFKGMEAVVTLSSLPQRNLSKITAEVTHISPQASKDENGTPIGYAATAEFRLDELQSALSGLDQQIQLSSDMPVSLALSGRDITFSEYLIAPFFKIYEGALQD